MFNKIKLDTETAKDFKKNVNLNKFKSLKRKNEDKKSP